MNTIRTNSPVLNSSANNHPLRVQGTAVKFFLSLLLSSLALPAAHAASEVPHAIVTVMPALPLDQAGQAARMELYVEINPDGYVTRAEVKSTSRVALSQSFLAAIRQWRYTPARENGVPVAGIFIQPFTYGNELTASAMRVSSPRKSQIVADWHRRWMSAKSVAIR